MRLHLLNVPQREGDSLQEEAISHFLPSAGVGGLQVCGGSCRQPLPTSFSVIHIKGAVTCRDVPSLGEKVGLYVCLPTGECFSVWGEDSLAVTAC